MKTRTVAIVSSVLTLAAMLLAAVALTGYFVGVRQALDHDVWLYLRPTDTRDSLDARLEAEMDAMSAFWTRLALDQQGVDQRLDGGTITGAYRLRAGLTPIDLARQLARHQQTPVRLTFGGYRSLGQLAGRMASQLMVDSLDVLAAMTDTAHLAACGMDEASVIGLFLPDTYQVYWDISPEQLMQRMRREYGAFWNEARRQQAESLGLTPREVTILCSIAEEETQDRVERGVVARLYYNRLGRGMLLQADPTVKYALGDFGLRRILYEHLAVDSPYNTYRVAGLPPGPIRMVEKATIDALLRSAPHDYLYMCAKPDFSGRHNFARTLAEHNANAAAYHAALDRQKRAR